MIVFFDKIAFERITSILCRGSLKKMASYLCEKCLQGIVFVVFIKTNIHAVQVYECNHHNSLQAYLVKGIGHSDCKQLGTTKYPMIRPLECEHGRKF